MEDELKHVEPDSDFRIMVVEELKKKQCESLRVARVFPIYFGFFHIIIEDTQDRI